MRKCDGKGIEEIPEAYEINREESLQTLIKYYEREIEKLKKRLNEAKKELAIRQYSDMEKVR